MPYHDLDILLREGPAGDWIADVRAHDGSEKEALITVPDDKAALLGKASLFEAKVLDSRGTVLVREPPAESADGLDAKTFGEELFRALLGGQASNIYRLSLSEARKQGRGLRIRLANEIPALSAIPWEFMYDSEEGEFLALSAETPLVRYARLARPRPALRISPPLRILGVIASPKDLKGLDVAGEVQRIERATRTARDAGLAELKWVETATWQELQKSLLPKSGPWHVFHYIGHGDYDDTVGEGLIALEDEDGNARNLHAPELSGLLADHESLRLCVFNSCSGARGGSEDRFSSTASALVRRGLPAVVAMQYEIGDLAAVGFAQTLYDSLAEGIAVDRAVAEARKAMRITARKSLEWGTPVLYMNSADGMLFGWDGPPTDSATPGPSVRARSREEHTKAVAEDERGLPLEERKQADSTLTPVDQHGWDRIERTPARSAVVGFSRPILVALVVGLGLTRLWVVSYPSSPVDSLYPLFAFAGILVATGVEALIRLSAARRHKRRRR